MRLKIQGGFYPNFISLKLLSFRLLIRLGDEGVSVTVYVGDGGFIRESELQRLVD